MRKSSIFVSPLKTGKRRGLKSHPTPLYQRGEKKHLLRYTQMGERKDAEFLMYPPRFPGYTKSGTKCDIFNKVR
jgi:hypothetical protein